MSIKSIREILAERTPAQLEHATETPDGVVIPLKKKTGWDRLAEERELGRALAPLADKNWTITTGPVKFRQGTYNEIIVSPPARATGIDTATLPLRDRIRVETKQARKRTGTDLVDGLEINEDDGTVTFDSTGSSAYYIRQIEQMAEDLRGAGWTGPISRRFGQSGIYGTLTAPEKGLNVSQARVEAFLI